VPDPLVGYKEKYRPNTERPISTEIYGVPLSIHAFKRL